MKFSIEKLTNASNGISLSKGGLNKEGIIEFLASKHIDVNNSNSRKVLEQKLATFLASTQRAPAPAHKPKIPAVAPSPLAPNPVIVKFEDLKIGNCYMFVDKFKKLRVTLLNIVPRSDAVPYAQIIMKNGKTIYSLAARSTQKWYKCKKDIIISKFDLPEDITNIMREF